MGNDNRISFVFSLLLIISAMTIAGTVIISNAQVVPDQQAAAVLLAAQGSGKQAFPIPGNAVFGMGRFMMGTSSGQVPGNGGQGNGDMVVVPREALMKICAAALPVPPGQGKGDDRGGDGRNGTTTRFQQHIPPAQPPVGQPVPAQGQTQIQGLDD